MIDVVTWKKGSRSTVHILPELFVLLWAVTDMDSTNTECKAKSSNSSATRDLQRDED